jgi:hypothetical protein
LNTSVEKKLSIPDLKTYMLVNKKGRSIHDPYPKTCECDMKGIDSI